jgi:hypothetical protein
MNSPYFLRDDEGLPVTGHLYWCCDERYFAHYGDNK